MGLTISELVKEIVKDWKEEVKFYSDEKLMEDRSYWMKNYGYVNGFGHDDITDGEEDILDSDIHTLAIELELKYKKDKKERITEKE